MSAGYKVNRIPTTPQAGQKPGTSGLRKQVPVFKGEHYTENFVQCMLDGGLGNTKVGSSLVVGGDGRYYCNEALQLIIQICAANGISRLIVAQNAFMSTPAVSVVIRKYKAHGGIIMTASHNPGGPKGDFGMKFNVASGGPAPEAITTAMFELTKSIDSYRICSDLKVDVSIVGAQTFQILDCGPFTVDVVDSVKDYNELMQEIYDFPKLRDLISGKITGNPIRVLADSLHGATGPYILKIVVDELGADVKDIRNAEPLPDFGGLHPDPNLTYAADLVRGMEEGTHDIGAAFDGDGDRNMILGKNAFFVTPGDSLAILAADLECIPYFQKTGVHGYARSMPTAAAVDRVAVGLGKECFETPTGWKFFGNLMDAGRISLCGEESFGTGSDHIREKDGLWTLLAWLSVIAHRKLSVEQICQEHWAKYGRNVFTRYDYEQVQSAQANAMMEHLAKSIADPSFVGSNHESGGKVFKIAKADDFEYTDPIDASVSKHQGIRIIFADGSRLVFRLSGTGSSGATIRMYVDTYVNDPAIINGKSDELLKPLISVAVESIAKIKDFTGREKPTVVT